MSDGDGVATQTVVPVAHPLFEHSIGFAPWRTHRPFVEQAPCVKIGIGGLTLRQRSALPLAVCDLSQAMAELIISRRQFEFATDELHGRTRTPQGTGDERKRGLVEAVTRQQTGENMSRLHRLLAAEIVQWNVLHTLQPA